MRQIVLPHGFTPRPHQARLMGYFDNGGKRASAIWHRRAGKDRTMLAQVSKMAHERVGLYWHMLPTAKQARKVVWDNITRDGKPLMRETFPDELVSARNETEMKVTLKVGSIVQLVGSDTYDSNVGANCVGATFSEWALTNPLAWEYIRPILLENDGWAAFITTPRGYNHAHKLHEIAKRTDSWFADLRTIDDTGGLSRLQYQAEIDSGMPEELARQEYLCDFSAANVGSVLGRWLEQADRAGRIHSGLALDVAAGVPVVVSSDIGVRDAAAWWFWIPSVDGFALIDYEQDIGLAAEDWIDRLRLKGYRYSAIWLPHDAAARTFASRRTVQEQFVAAKLAQSIRIVPMTSIKDRVNAARSIMSRCEFDADRCETGLQMLRDWSFEWDDDRKVFGEHPRHDYASHGGDAFSYGALVMREKKLPEPGPGPIEGIASMTYDQLLREHDKRVVRKGRL